MSEQQADLSDANVRAMLESLRRSPVLAASALTHYDAECLCRSLLAARAEIERLRTLAHKIVGEWVVWPGGANQGSKNRGQVNAALRREIDGKRGDT